jgi:hypothetical protein
MCGWDAGDAVNPGRGPMSGGGWFSVTWFVFRE